jgi:hypothetical protein
VHKKIARVFDRQIDINTLLSVSHASEGISNQKTSKCTLAFESRLYGFTADMFPVLV